MTFRRHALPRLLVVSAAALTAVAVPTLSAPAAQAANTKLTGTITWTRTVAINEGAAGSDTRTGTETTTGSLKVKIARNAQSYGSWNGTDKAGSYAGTYALDTTANEVSQGAVDCVVTNQSAGKGAGKVPVYGSMPKGPTKGIIVTANPRYTGTATVTYTGQGISPCDSGQDGDPIDGSLLPINDSRTVCYPAGTSSKLATPTASQIVGGWNAKKKAYVFDCTKTFPETSDGGRTVTVKISGTLKWS